MQHNATDVKNLSNQPVINPISPIDGKCSLCAKVSQLRQVSQLILANLRHLSQYSAIIERRSH
jgi:hypothetical protein